jgi:glutaredoxin 2
MADFYFAGEGNRHLAINLDRVTHVLWNQISETTTVHFGENNAVELTKEDGKMLMDILKRLKSESSQAVEAMKQEKAVDKSLPRSGNALKN